jgi:hypothetical protein
MRKYISILPKCRKSLFSTFHEQGAGGINGKLAHFIQSREYESAISLFEASPIVPNSISSLNYLIDAYFSRGRHMDAIILAKKIDELQLSPNLQTFNYLMKGLALVDTAGTLALSVDEIFQLMPGKYGIIPDWQSWLFRIQAFIRPKFMTAPHDNCAPKLFYEQMRSRITERTKILQTQSELLITAVNRRIWSFAEYMLSEMKQNDADKGFLFPAWEQICLAKGLFSEIGCVPVLRELQQFSLQLSRYGSLVSPLSSINLHRNILNFAARQGRSCADLAFYSINFLLHQDAENSKIYLSLASRVINRTVPIDLEFFNASDMSATESVIQISGLLSLVEKLRCPDDFLIKLKSAINFA